MKDLKITEIEYSELKTGSGYDNKKIAIKCIVPDGENPDDVLNKAKEYVQEKLNEDEKIRKNQLIKELQSEIQILIEQRQILRNEVDDLEELKQQLPIIKYFIDSINRVTNVSLPF